MRLVSNKESVTRGEVSILAIVETLLAIALVFYLSAHFNTLRWLAIAMCVAPLLLLRTDESTRLGVDWFKAWAGYARRHIERTLPSVSWVDFIANLSLFVLGTALAIFGIRIFATAYAIVRDPISALRAIPRNWARTTLSLDSRFPLELIPDHPRATFGIVFEGFRRQRKGTRFISVLLVPLFIPALLYRWSLKATSIIYAPLVFVAHSTFSEGADLQTKLELIKRGDLSRIRVWYGVIAITAFLLKLVLMMNLPGFADWWNGHPFSQFLALYVAPAEIPKWQLAELANSVLAIGAMLFARRALLGYELQHPWPEAPVKRLLGFVSGLRWLLALYAILCTGYITMRAAQHWHWPALGEQWLPW
jgi:hypothetical protein